MPRARGTESHGKHGRDLEVTFQHVGEYEEKYDPLAENQNHYLQCWYCLA